MVTKAEIVAYHAKDLCAPSPRSFALELELFCLDAKTLTSVPYLSPRGVSLHSLFEYLQAHEGYQSLDAKKTFGIQKGEQKLTLEPGSQLEFGSAIHQDVELLLQEFEEYLQLLRRLGSALGLHWLDAAYYPVGLPEAVGLLPKPRYAILDRYWRQIGNYGPHYMRFTSSLQICLDYENRRDLEEKVTRALLLKPLLHVLTAHSRIRNGEDSQLRSFRMLCCQAEPARMGDPGSEAMWNQGRWTLDEYLHKVFQAPTIFALDSSAYEESDHRPFEMSFPTATMDAYLFHLSTMFMDIRVRQYIEIRYLDNPGIPLVPAITLVMSHLLYDDELWHAFVASLPYRFADVPYLTDLLNTISPEAEEYWVQYLQRPALELLQQLQTRLKPSLRQYLQPLLEKARRTQSYDALPDLTRPEDILSSFAYPPL